MWPRGEGSGYHPLTWGYLVGELARRLDPRGRTLGTVLREEITHAPGHDPLDVWIGLPDEEHERVAEIRRPSAVPDMGEINPETRAAFLTRWAAPSRGGAIWRRIEIPSANAHASARDLARLYGFFADGLSAAGRPILRHQATREAMLRTRISGPDRVLPFTVEFACGVYRNRFGVYGPSQAAFGHSGWGGSMGMGDPATGISCAYIMNRQSNHLHADPRPNALLAALYSCEPVRVRL
jgi:CubicO group peptidase (beta-lactamase class C family)